jgi:hypothetical protein
VRVTGQRGGSAPPSFAPKGYRRHEESHTPPPGQRRIEVFDANTGRRLLSPVEIERKAAREEKARKTAEETAAREARSREAAEQELQRLQAEVERLKKSGH